MSLALAEAPEAAKRVVKRQLEEACTILQAKELRLADLQRDLRGLAGLEADAEWLVRTVARFDELWSALTDANRGVLVQLVVQQVLLDPRRQEIQSS